MTAARSPRGMLRLSAEARGMLPWCIVLSVAVHVLLLTAAASPGPRAGGLVHDSRRSGGPISVRLVAERTAPGPFAVEPARSGQTAPPQMALPPEPIQASAPDRASGRVAPTAREEAASAATGLPSMPSDPADGGYVPRPLLTQAPIARTPVLIAMPRGPVEVGRRVGVLVLYIDEQGRVRRIEAEPPPLPPAMEQAAREAFATARFSPGQVDGQVVRSRIRVEVTFDAGSAPATPVANAASVASAPRADSAASAASAAHAASGNSAMRAAPGASAARAGGDQRSR